LNLENQILLNSTVDLSNSKKDQRTINIDQSLSNARLYHLVMQKMKNISYK